MTWAKLDDRFNDHPILLGLPRSTRLLYVEGLVWACKQETDGAIPTGAVPRFTDATDLDEHITQLIASGLWTTTDTGWQIVDFLENQRPADEIREGRRLRAARQDRWRRHTGGDHSRCQPRYCKDASCNASTDALQDGLRDAPPSRPDPSRSQTGTGRAGPWSTPASGGWTTPAIPPLVIHEAGGRS